VTQAIPGSDALDPLTYLVRVLRDDAADVKRRDWAAGLLLTFMHECRPSVARVPPRERARQERLSRDEQRQREFAERVAEILHEDDDT